MFSRCRFATPSALGFPRGLRRGFCGAMHGFGAGSTRPLPADTPYVFAFPLAFPRDTQGSKTNFFVAFFECLFLRFSVVDWEKDLRVAHVHGGCFSTRPHSECGAPLSRSSVAHPDLCSGPQWHCATNQHWQHWQVNWRGTIVGGPKWA